MGVLLMTIVMSFGSLFFGFQIGVMTLAQDTIWAVFNVDKDS